MFIDTSQPLTNLRISGCEFPQLQSARNPVAHNYFSQDNTRFQQPNLIQQPTLQTQNFSTAQSGLLYSPNRNYNTSSPFRPQTQFDAFASSQMRSFSPAQKDINTLTPSKLILNHYDRIIQEFELYSKQRAMTLREGLSRIVDGLKTDEIISAMREDPLSQNYAFHRMKEVIDHALISESEQVIANLRSENVLLRERILILEADTQKKLSMDQDKVVKKLKQTQNRKNHYKQQLKQSQQQISQLLEKFKESEGDSQKQQTEHDYKLAQKDGELARCEKVLSEVSAMLSEKTLSQNRLENNLSNEVTVLSDRIMGLERERNEMIDKYQKYGEEFKQLMNQEQNNNQQKLQKYKDKGKELRLNIERSQNIQNELETQIRSYIKEIDDQRIKIEDLVKQTQEKGFKLKDVEEKQFIQEKDLSSQMKEQKQKYKFKIQQLQATFEKALQDKCHSIENEARDRVILLENEKKEIEMKFMTLSQNIERQQDDEKQQQIIQQKQMEKKIEKLQQRFEHEISLKLGEAEEQFKELEQKIRKEHKQENKTFALQQQQLNEQNQQEFILLQERYESEFREMSYKLREEIDNLQKANQEQRITIAELNILEDTHKAESDRLNRENDNLQSIQREILSEHKQEIKLLEDKLQYKIQENDDKVKIALDGAIKHQNLEQIASQYAHELDKKQQEINNQKEANIRLGNKFDKIVDENKVAHLDIQSTRQLLNDKEFKICRLQTINNEALSKILQFTKLQSSKHKSEMEYLKRHFLSELEMNKKQIESQLLAIISKAREISYTQKFKFEKLQYSYEQRFQKDFNARELEWEKVWEKREDILGQKEKSIKELEIERIQLRETIVRNELELTQLKSQLSSNKKDLQRQYEEVRSKLTVNEQKQSELDQSYKRAEEQLVNQQRQQLNEMKFQMQQRSQEELKKLENQMYEYREKSKIKVNELAHHIQESQGKHRQEMIQLKQIFEEKIKGLETDNDNKQKTLYESQNQINMLSIKYEQYVKDNESLEKQVQSLVQNEKQLIEQLATLKQNHDQLYFEREDLIKQKSELENELNQLDTQNRTLQSQIYTADRKLVQQKRELKTRMRKLNQSKQREMHEVQFLNDILTKSASSAHKISRKTSIASPDFKRDLNRGIGYNQGYNTFRAEPQQMNQSTGNYGSILSEINNMIDANQMRMSSTQSRGQLSSNTRNIMNSPSVNQLHPSMTFYHKSILKSPESKLSNNENIQMRISDLKQQQQCQ